MSGFGEPSATEEVNKETAATADSQSQDGLAIADEEAEHNAVTAKFGDGDISTRLLDESDDSSSLQIRVKYLEEICDQQTKYFLEWSKTGGAVATLAGHVALLARAFCIMEKRYGITPENSMGEYLFKKMESSIPDEMRQAAVDAGFNMTVEDTPQKPTIVVKRRAPASPQQTPAKVAKKDAYKAYKFELNGIEFVSKEQPHIKTDGNMCVSYIDGTVGCMLYMVADGLVPEFPIAIIEAAQKLVVKALSQQKQTEQQQAERLSMFMQHVLKLFIGSKMKLPVVVCAKLDPDAPRDTLKAFASAQGQLGGPLLKLGAITTGLVEGGKKLSDAEKASIVNVMQRSIVHLHQVLGNWAGGSGRFDVQKFSKDDFGKDDGGSSSAVDAFEDN